MKRILYCLIALCCAAMQVSAQAAKSPIRFGVMAHNADHETQLHYAPLYHFISTQMAPEEVQLVFIEPTNLDLTDIQTQTDFLLTDPYHYLHLRATGKLRLPLLS